MGAWEVVARYDNKDLNDAGASISGGEMDTLTGGVNWHLTDPVCNPLIFKINSEGSSYRGRIHYLKEMIKMYSACCAWYTEKSL